MTNGVTIGASLGFAIGVEAIVVTSVTFEVTIAEVAFGVKSATLKVAIVVTIGVLTMVVFAVTIRFSIGGKIQEELKP